MQVSEGGGSTRFPHRIDADDLSCEAPDLVQRRNDKQQCQRSALDACQVNGVQEGGLRGGGTVQRNKNALVMDRWNDRLLLYASGL